MARSGAVKNQWAAAAPGQIRVRNRARILRAAEQVFAEQGYRGATTAAIAECARLPKANIHYYFGTKEALYRAVLDNILELWLNEMDEITADKDPAEALSRYIRAKVTDSKIRPHASKVFANEVIRGARAIKGFLRTDLLARVEEKARVLDAWAAAGKMDPVDPIHFFSIIWAATQHYADFDEQLKALIGCRKLSDRDYERAVDLITSFVLKGCGVRR